MPIIEILDEDGSDAEHVEQLLEELIKTLAESMNVPKAFQHPDWNVNDASALLAWRSTASNSINKILLAVRNSDELALDQQFASIIEIVVPFAGSGPWVNGESNKSAEEILSILGPASQAQVRTVLLQVVKPAFEKAAQNEQLKSETATKINRAINVESMYHAEEDNIWKDRPGLVDIILWCLDSLQEQDWDTLWPLLIPPVLTYMDDWEAFHRLQGVNICRRLIERAPSSTLTRTGIDELMRSSLETSLLRYSDSISPLLFERAMRASLELVEKTTNAGSPERFQRLFSLLGESIIGGAWMYGYREINLIQATYEVLPLLLDAIGIACVRYLKALIPQLLHTLIPASEIEVSISIQDASLRALRKVIQIAAPRMAYWSGEIVSGISKCWVSHSVQSSGGIKTLLVGVLRDLREACPEIFQEHIRTLRELDEKQFAPFIQLAE